jgi:hypothetical protein
MGRWSTADDSKLSDLFRDKKVDYTKCDSKYIHTIINQYFSDKKYEAFAPLYRRKCGQWRIAQTLAGGRNVEGGKWLATPSPCLRQILSLHLIGSNCCPV